MGTYQHSPSFPKKNTLPPEIAERNPTHHLPAPIPSLTKNLRINPSTSDHPTHHHLLLLTQPNQTAKQKDNSINSILLLLFLEILLVLLVEKSHRLATP
jgi:hypothetical protein